MFWPGAWHEGISAVSFGDWLDWFGNGYDVADVQLQVHERMQVVSTMYWFRSLMVR